MVDRIQTEWGSIPADWKLLEVDAIKSAEKRSLAMGPFGSNIKSDNYKKYGCLSSKEPICTTISSPVNLSS